MAKRKAAKRTFNEVAALASANAALDQASDALTQAQQRIDKAKKMLANVTATDNREDAADMAAIAHVKGLLASGTEEVIPGDVVKRLDAGESPVRVFREFRGLTQNDLAGQIGVGQAFISQIESGAKQPSGSNLARLAKALNIDADLLLPDPD